MTTGCIVCACVDFALHWTMSDSPASTSSVSPVESSPVRPRGRGRRGRPPGRPGGASRGRGRGKRGRGPGMRLEEEDLARLKDLQANRQQQAEEMINKLTEQEAKEVLRVLVRDTPSVLLSVREKLHGAFPQPDPGPGSRPQDPQGWCYCTNCPQMPTDAENLCCGMSQENCLSTVPEMDLLVLEPMVLHMQILYRNDLFAIGATEEADVNKSRRHAAYRQFVLWQHGRLGVGNRRIVPACCVKVIRARYPDPHGAYTGFIPGRLH